MFINLLLLTTYFTGLLMIESVNFIFDTIFGTLNYVFTFLNNFQEFLKFTSFCVGCSCIFIAIFIYIFTFITNLLTLFAFYRKNQRFVLICQGQTDYIIKYYAQNFLHIAVAAFILSTIVF